MGRSGAVIGSGMVRVTLRGSQRVSMVHALHALKSDLVIWFMKRTVMCADDTPAACVSCVQRMATWRCEDKQRSDVCLVTTLHHV